MQRMYVLSACNPITMSHLLFRIVSHVLLTALLVLIPLPAKLVLIHKGTPLISVIVPNPTMMSHLIFQIVFYVQLFASLVPIPLIANPVGLNFFNFKK
jgi:hypothetical protein